MGPATSAIRRVVVFLLGLIEPFGGELTVPVGLCLPFDLPEPFCVPRDRYDPRTNSVSAMRKPQISTDVFLSVGRTYLPEQEAFVADLEATLRGLESIREPSGAATFPHVRR